MKNLLKIGHIGKLCHFIKYIIFNKFKFISFKNVKIN